MEKLAKGGNFKAEEDAYRSKEMLQKVV